MEKSKHFKGIIKWLSILMVFLSVCVSLFGGAERVIDRELLPEWRQETTGIANRWNLNLGLIQQELENGGYYVDASGLREPVLYILQALADGKVSPFEHNDILSYARWGEPLGIYLYYSYVDQESFKVMEIESHLIYLFVLITIVTGITVIVLHLKGSRLPGISIVIMSIVWLVFWFAVSIEYDHNLYGPISNLLIGYGYFDERISASPIVALFFSVTSMVLWINRDRNIEFVREKSNRPKTRGIFSSGSNRRSKQFSGARSPINDGNTKKCRNCGRVLNPGAVFCPSCGTKYVEPVRQEQPVYQTDNTNSSVQEKEFCPNCGAELDSDAIFCGSCGYKRS